jgi:hypothetical protein
MLRSVAFNNFPPVCWGFTSCHARYTRVSYRLGVFATRYSSHLKKPPLQPSCLHSCHPWSPCCDVRLGHLLLPAMRTAHYQKWGLLRSATKKHLKRAMLIQLFNSELLNSLGGTKPVAIPILAAPQKMVYETAQILMIKAAKYLIRSTLKTVPEMLQ